VKIREMAAIALLACSSQGAVNPFGAVRSLLRGITASLPDPIDYGALRGLPRSFGQEAGEYALQGVVPEKSKDGWCIATFAGGCFWGTELHFQRVPGVVSTCVGYTEGRLEKPTYQEVCSGRTGHTEACQIIYDPQKVDFTKLCKVLFRTIDPTLRDRVGNDYGSQYRHGIYAHSDAQLAAAKAHIEVAQAKLPPGRSVVTECKRASIFWPAEELHRTYRRNTHYAALAPHMPLSGSPRALHVGVSPFSSIPQLLTFIFLLHSTMISLLTEQYLAKGGRFGSPQSAAKQCKDPVRCYG
jgi:peptide-methionine (S)-S-oxide reductase